MHQFDCAANQTYAVEVGHGGDCGSYFPGIGCLGSPTSCGFSPYLSNWVISVEPNSGDCCTDPVAISGPGPHAFDNTSASTAIDGQLDLSCSQYGSTALLQDVWLRWQTPSSGTAWLTTCGTTTGNPKVAVRLGSDCSAPPIVCADDTVCGNGVLLSFPVIAASDYMIQIGRSPTDASGAAVVGSFRICVSASTADCDLDGVPDACEIEFGWELDCNGNLTSDSCEVASGSVPDCNVDGIPDGCQGGPLTVLGNPADQLVNLGTTATFSVTAAGIAPLQYQWRRNGVNLVDGGGINGSTTNELSIANAGAADRGAYDVIVSDACGVLPSASAELDLVAGESFCYGDGWEAASWFRLEGSPGSDVYDFEVFDDGSGPRLFAATSSGVHAWNGSTWTSLPLPPGVVRALTVGDGDGPGPQPVSLFAGGEFDAAAIGLRHVARWNGTTWVALGSGATAGVDGVVNDLQFFGSPGSPVPSLYVGGDFSSAGGQSITDVARWDGFTWFSAGSFPNFGSGRRVTSFATHLGSLYAALDASAGTARGLYTWNAGSWIQVLQPGSPILALASFDPDGTGAAPADLYMGLLGGSALMRLGGSSSFGIAGTVERLFAVDATVDQPGRLFVTGTFATAGGASAASLAFFDGTSMRVPAEGLVLGPNVGTGRALAVAPTIGGSGSSLYVGGTFDAAGGVTASRAARATLDSVLCPCGNVGAAGRGCANSTNPAGALLRATGVTADDSIVLHGSGMPATVTCIYLQGDLQGSVVFGDGVRCAGGNLIRLRAKANSSGASSYPDLGDPSVAARGQVTPGSGVVRQYQTYYRNAATAFCPPATFNATNGIRLVW
ncbi:MAG: immunoglobulin domain-containing protein [Planctomycetes bacterium]|nr:immunoglobulin domain-containing protein [Planctomycetota bacterium]